MDTELPASPLLVRVLAEHPWSLVTPLLVVGALLAWYGARNDKLRVILCGIGTLLVSAGILVVAAIWQSPGEAAAAAVQRLVTSAEHADIPAVTACFEPDATIHYGSTTAVGHDIADILNAAQSLQGRHRIESNTVTELGYATIDDDTAQVLLGCRTTTASSFGPIPTRWWLELRRQHDGSWLISRLAFLRFLNQTATRGTI